MLGRGAWGCCGEGVGLVDFSMVGRDGFAGGLVLGLCIFSSHYYLAFSVEVLHVWSAGGGDHLNLISSHCCMAHPNSAT